MWIDLQKSPVLHNNQFVERDRPTMQIIPQLFVLRPEPLVVILQLLIGEFTFPFSHFVSSLTKNYFMR